MTHTTDLYTAENQTLNNATNTLKDIIIEFGVQQPVPNPYLLSNEDGQKNRASFTYETTKTEQFWFHSDHTSTVLSTSLGSSNYISNIVGYVTQHNLSRDFGIANYTGWNIYLLARP